MDFRRLRDEARRALAQGLGTARLLLEKLPPPDRDRLLRAAATAAPDGPALVESPQGAFHAGLIARLGSPGLPQRLLADLAAMEGESASAEQVTHLRGVLCELLVLGAPLPPLPFYRWVEEEGDLFPRIPALRALAADGDAGRLRQLIAATAEALEDPYDARDWGEALAAAGPEARPVLREVLLDPRPWVRMGAAYGLASLAEEDHELETLADIVSFDPDPSVRVNAVELRSESSLSDPGGVAARLLEDPATQPYFDTWLWSFACEALPAHELPGVLRRLEAHQSMDCYDAAELLGSSQHPLAVQLLLSRLYTADAEARAVYLEALEHKGVDIREPATRLFEVHDAPPRVLVLRASLGEEEALAALFEGMLSGTVPSQDLEGDEADLVRKALLPRALARLEGADLETWAILMSHFRDQLPPERRGLPAPGLFEHPNPQVVQEFAIELLESASPEARAGLARFLADAPTEVVLPVLESLGARPPPPDPDLVRPLLASEDPRLRGRARRVLLGWLRGHAAGSLLLEGLTDPYAPNRAEALMVARVHSLPVDLDPVRPLLFDSLDETRAEAARMLVERDPRRALPWLEEALEDEPTIWVAEILHESVEALRALEPARGGRP